MKRIIASFISLFVTGALTINVISCAPKVSQEVILEVQTDNQGSSIVQAYQKVVAQYNAERPNNPRRLKLLVTPRNSIKDKIATGRPLPNLYLAYADLMATYDMLLQLRDGQRQVVNIASVINWDEGKDSQWWNSPQDQWLPPYLNNGSLINPEGLTGNKTLDQVTGIEGSSFRPFINSFLHESLIPGKAPNSKLMYAAPVVKSNFIGVVNLRLLNELIVDVLGTKLKISDRNSLQIRVPYFIKNPNNIKRMQLNSHGNPYRLSPRNRYFSNSTLTYGEFFAFHFSSPISAFALQRFLGDLSNVEVLLSAYWNLVGSQTNNTNDHWIKTIAYGTDDVNATLGLMQGQLSGDFTQITKWDPQDPFSLSINTQNPSLHQGTSDFLDFIRWSNQLKPLEADGGSAADHGNGGIGIKANSISKDYYSNQWLRQGMLLYYGSSSGIKYLSGDSENQVHSDEILLAPIPVYEHLAKKEDWSLLFRQQGPGLGMFKDSNVEKNQIAIDFLNFFLTPRINTEFAIQTGYLPTNYWAYYQKSEILGSLLSHEAPYYRELIKGNQSRIKGALLVRDLVDSLALNQVKLWVTSPSPFDDALINQVIQPWFQKHYKTFFNEGPSDKNLTWEAYEREFHREAKRIINSMLPGISHIIWNGTIER